MAFMLKQRISLSASIEYIVVNFIAIRGYHDKPVRELAGHKIKINKTLMYDHKEPPQVYHLRINGKIIPYNDLDKFLDKPAGDVNDFAMIFQNTIGLEPEVKTKFSYSEKNTKLMGKLVASPLVEPITIPKSSEVVMDVSVGDVAGSGLANVPLPAVPIEIKEQNAAILRQAYEDFLAGNYPFEKIQTEEDIESAYNNKKIFVIEKDKMHTKGAVVIGHEGLYFIKRGKENYYPWSEIKQVHWGWLTYGSGHPARKFTVKLHDWNDKKVLYFTPGKYSQKEFKVNLLAIGPAALKSARIFESLFQKYWKPEVYKF